MAGLLEKIGLLIGANMHDLVNRALRANSVAVMDEQIRRAHESLEQLEDTIAQIIADLKIEERKNRELKDSIVSLDRDARTLLTTGKESQAAILVKQKQLKQAALEKSEQAQGSINGDLTKLQQAKTSLELKISELKATRDTVDQALKIAKTKGRIVQTFNDLTDVLEESGAAGTADWAESVKAKADIKLEQTLEKHGPLLDPTADPGVAAELERMKAELGK
jgi:phage shock protein A